MRRGAWGSAASAAIAAAVLGVSAGAAAAPADWLILASGPDPLKLLLSHPPARTGARVMASADCAEYRPGLFVLAIPANRASTTDPVGSYRKRCTPKPGSLTALGIPAVDPSFAALREEPVNFGGRDIVTTIRSGMLVRPWYMSSAQDPREGLRVAVDDIAGARRPIDPDCFGAEVARGAGYIALACATEQVADQSIYRTRVYRARDLARVREIPHCRKPRLMPGAVACEAQATSMDGQVTTTIKRFPLS